jgi:gliding-associated putative ABC transporter substrate-binding component GldG
MKNLHKQNGWIIALIVLIAVNFIAAQVHPRVDLTEEKRYSLSNGTKELLRSLDDELVIRVFLKGDFPAGFRKLSNTTQEFVALLKETNRTRIRYYFTAPDEEAGNGKTWADSLAAAGIAPINLTVQVKTGQENKLVFPVALIMYKGRTEVVDLYPGSKRVVSAEDLANAEAGMEYGFLKNIAKLVNPERPSVAYAVGHGQPTDVNTYDLQQIIGGNYRFGTFDLKMQSVIPQAINALLIVKPTEAFSSDEKLKIDQYIMRGGKVVWFLDNLHAEQDSLRYKPTLIAYDRGLNLDDLLFRYGVRINPDLLMDLQCDYLPFAVGGSASNPQFEFLQWNYYPLFEPRGNHLINKNLGLVAGRFVNSIDTIATPGIKKTFLLQSSANARTISTPALISLNENRNAPQDAQFKQRDVPTAVLLEGTFTSLFKARISRAQADSLAAQGGFKESSDSTGKMVVVADGDMVLNDFSTKENQPLPMGMNLFTAGSQYEYRFANRDFLINILEYLTSDAGLIESRNKEVILRLLDPKKTESQKTQWQLINIALPVFLVVLAGVVYQQLRRRRFAG